MKKSAILLVIAYVYALVVTVWLLSCPSNEDVQWAKDCTVMQVRDSLIEQASANIYDYNKDTDSDYKHLMELEEYVTTAQSQTDQQNYIKLHKETYDRIMKHITNLHDSLVIDEYNHSLPMHVCPGQ